MAGLVTKPPEIIKLQILRTARKMGSIIKSLDFRRQASVCSEKR